ncbi:MAG TPA: MarC family protein [Thermoanaerobaculia bacterium]|nr:MarC family protein [Thermoanaerobaculia bacterium]
MNEPAAPFPFAVLAFSSLFSVVNPISGAPVFVSLTAHLSHGERRRAAVRAVLTGLATLAVFSAAGGAIFSFFGITVPAFQITGGILFALMSLRALEHGHEEVPETSAPGRDPSIVPVGIPLIAGPGAISTVMVLVGQAGGASHRLALGGAIAATLAVTLAILLAAPAITRRLGDTGMKITNKVMALITAVIGIQFVINGTTAVAVQILRAAR